MITNKQLKEILWAIMEVIPSSGHSQISKSPVYKLILAIPDEEPVPKTGFDPNEALPLHVKQYPILKGKETITHPQDPDHDEYMTDKPKGDPDIEHD